MYIPWLEKKKIEQVIAGWSSWTTKVEQVIAGWSSWTTKVEGIVRVMTGLPRFVPLATPLTSTSWDGDARSTTGATLIDLSAVFGVTAGVKAVLATITVADSGSAAATDIGVTLNPSNGTWYLSPLVVRCGGLANGAYATGSGVVPCDSNGDVYYQVIATGTNTMTVRLVIWGYWI